MRGRLLRAFRRGPGPAPCAAVVTLGACLALGACESRAQRSDAPVPSAATPASRPELAALHDRISEPGGFFDTDNLISNETGYLKVVDALRTRGLSGGAYLGVGPDQNYSYLAVIRPEIAFIIDVRRDNTLHHLLLKALMERSATRAEFLAALHGRPAPADGEEWATRDAAEIVAWIERAAVDREAVAALQDEVEETISGYGIPLSDEDRATVRRFHDTFVEAGPGLRFTSLGRPPRPFYPTYRELVLETDLAGRPASYLASAEAYRFVRRMHREDRIVPVVGDLAGPRALREIGAVLREMGQRVSAIYASNVEFYLWRAGTFDAWLENVAALPADADAVVIRSYFPNGGRMHPSAVPGYYAAQSLQPLSVLRRGVVEEPFTSYWDVITRDLVDLRAPIGAR